MKPQNRVVFEEREARLLRAGDRILVGDRLARITRVDPLVLDPHSTSGWPVDDRDRVEVFVERHPRDRTSDRPDYRLAMHRPDDLRLVAQPLFADPTS